MIGELDSDVSSDTAVMIDFPNDGSEWTVGVLGRALVLDGVEQHFQHGTPLPRSEGTIGHWLRPGTDTGTRVALYESDYTGAPSPDYNGFGAQGEALEIHTGIFDGDFYAVWQDGGVPDRREVRGGTVTAGAWTHVALTWSIPGEMRLYVNCVEVDSTSMDAAFDGRLPTESFFGKPSQFGGRNWPGAIDEIKVWNRAFSATRVRNHFCTDRRGESEVLTEVTPTAGHRFGESLAYSDDWLVVRSPGASEVSWYRQQSGGTFQFHSNAPADFSPEMFVPAEVPKLLDIADGIAAVTDAGNVDVYRFNGGTPGSWIPEAVLSVPGREGFGFAVSASGERVAVGAPSSGGGGVYVFERNQGGPGAWEPTFAKETVEFSTVKLLGKFADLDGDLLVVYSQSTAIIGAEDIVEIFRRGELGGVAGWSSEGEFRSELNSIVALAARGDRIAVGVVESGSGENGIIVRQRNVGGANQWGLEHVLVASDGDDLDRLGANLTWLDNETLVAAALGTNRDHQALYVFKTGGSILKDQETILVQRTFDPISSIGASLGISLTGSDDLILAGAPLTGPSLTQPPGLPGFSGRVHVFDLGAIFNDRFEADLP